MIGRLWNRAAGDRSASKAKDRLSIVIARQRMSREGEDVLVEDIRKAIFDVVKRHFTVEETDFEVQVKTESPDTSEMELNIDIHGIKEKSARKG